MVLTVSSVFFFIFLSFKIRIIVLAAVAGNEENSVEYV